MRANPEVSDRAFRTIRAWAALLIALFLIYLLVANGIPWLSHAPGFKDLSESNTGLGIEATGLFYTDNPEFSRSENFFRSLKASEESASDP